MQSQNKPCPDCDLHQESDNRRRFLKHLGVSALAAGSAQLFAHVAGASSTSSSAAETTVGEFYKSLTDDQRKAVCLPFDHKLRQRISPNWHVVKPTIGDIFTEKQRTMVLKIIREVT